MRSITMPTTPDTINAAGTAMRMPIPIWFGRGLLNDISRIGPDHDQLPMGHVNNTDDTKGDGQADGG